MRHGVLVLCTLLSVMYFPWPYTAFLALLSAMDDPLVPLAAGLFMDTLYYTPSLHTYPQATIFGALATLIVWFVRTRLRTGIMN